MVARHTANAMSVKVVHLALTPLAGSPVRIVDALNKHTGVEARLVVRWPDMYGSRTFPGDLEWEGDVQAATAARATKYPT